MNKYVIRARRVWGFWFVILFISGALCFVFNVVFKLEQTLNLHILCVILILITSLLLLVRVEGPLLISRNPFSDSLFIHENPLRFLENASSIAIIKPMARTIQSQLPLWFANGHKEINMRSHLFGGKSEGELERMAVNFSRDCDEVPDIFVCKKKDFVTRLNKFQFTLFCSGICVSEQDGIIVYKNKNTNTNNQAENINSTGSLY